MRSMGPVIFLGTTRRSARSPTALQAQTLVLRAGVDVVAVDESVAVDEGNHAADGVDDSANYFAVVKVDESVAANERDYAGDRVDNAAISAAAAQGTGADVGDSNCHAAVQHPRRGNCCHPSDDRC